MKNRKINTIRLDKTNVDAPTINRALDNIISNVNTFIGETTTAIDNISTTSASPVTINGGYGIAVSESPTNTFSITNTLPGSVQNVIGGTGIAVANLGGGTYQITNTLPEDTNIIAGSGIGVVEGPTGTFTITNTGGGANGAKASVNFDPTPLVGAMQQTGNSIAISMTNNGMAVGDHFWLKDSTGTIDEYCVVASVITTTNFTATSPVSRTTGVIACTRTIWVRAEYNIASVEALVSPGSSPGWYNQVYRIYFTTNLGTDRYYPMCSSDLSLGYNNQWAASIGPAYFYTPAPINSGAIWIGSPNTYPYNNVSLICY